MDEWVWSNGGTILTGENWSTGRKTLYSMGGRWMNGYGAMMKWYWQGKTEVLGEKHYTAWVVDEWMSMEQWWNATDRGKQVLGENSAIVALRPPQMSHGLSCYQTQLHVLNSRWLNMWAMARPVLDHYCLWQLSERDPLKRGGTWAIVRLIPREWNLCF